MSQNKSKYKKPARGQRALQSEARREKMFQAPRDLQHPKRLWRDHPSGRPASTPEPTSEPASLVEAVPEVPTDATVIEIFSGGCWVRQHGEVIRAKLPPLGTLSVSSLVAGDEIGLDLSGGEALVRAVAPRRATLSRPDPGNPSRELIIAANVDIILVVAAAKDPPLRPRLLDRYLIAAGYSGVRAVIVVNKCDLLGPDERIEYQETVAPYEPIGARVFFASAHTGEGGEALRAELSGQRAVLVGHSGVGKSSLCNLLLGGTAQGVGAVAKHGRGRHTTTSARLLDLPGSGQLIDTPGVREFGLWGVSRDELAGFFAEIAARAGSCRFSDCVHDAEPGCAVKAARDAGDISAARYQSYLALLHGDE